MIVINGESASGKSTAALRFIERHKEKSLYILMERDASMSKILHSEGFDYAVYGNGHIIDIKYRILERGGLMSNDLEYVVVDSLGMIKDPISQMAKLSELEKIEKDFGLKIILLLNLLKMKNIKSATREFNQYDAIKKSGRFEFYRPEEIFSLLQKGASQPLL
jgi:hypothetical protein